jgi:hypothetical protein
MIIFATPGQAKLEKYEPRVPRKWAPRELPEAAGQKAGARRHRRTFGLIIAIVGTFLLLIIGGDKPFGIQIVSLVGDTEWRCRREPD